MVSFKGFQMLGVNVNEGVEAPVWVVETFRNRLSLFMPELRARVSTCSHHGRGNITMIDKITLCKPVRLHVGGPRRHMNHVRGDLDTHVCVPRTIGFLANLVRI